ncbi:MAG: translation elongation factor Ts [Actinobacteria bacterium]|nr:translation elongation factor Ts [Actinomycetota bacterium]
MTITASQVKELRDMTGAGMMDCKRALQDTGGDLEEARRLLREKGMASAGKRAGRETTEGKVLIRVEGDRGAIVAVGSETEPVSGNEDFGAFAERALELAFTEGPDALADLEEERLDLVGRLGENIALRGAARVEAGEGERLAAYVHPPASKIGVLVRARASEELARMVAMHIAASRPQYARREEVPAEDIRREREIYEKLPEVGSKPEHIRPQIVEGMIGKRFFADAVLLDQPWIHDPALTVGKALSEHGAEVLEFVRYSVTE